ncbi:transglutaminase domain-containing protein [Flintibacter sp.]|uniref:transglutaminase domain-containing protein n=1 Tax=Flintibacter sp. TaxID=1918624 RepID=UPI003D0ACBE9|nr:hypothetical protein [Flintibacter sp.]
MRKMMCAVMAALMLLSTGCSSMLNRDYSSVTVHSATPTAEGDANTMRVQNYQELVNALIYLINQGEESGSIRYSGEEADFKKLMDEACLEVKQEDPLGAYAVDYIKYSVISIVGSYEADVQITYRRTREQVASIVDATGAAAIRSELSRALSSFDTEVVLRISYFEEDEAYIQQLVRQAYLSNPATALDFPDAQVAMYPESGQQRIVEVTLTYHQSLQTLESWRNSLSREAERICQPLTELTIKEKLDGITGTLQSLGAYSAQGGSTAYDALLGGGGDSQGVALAFSLLCRQVGITCSVVDGQKNGQSHFWNVVQTASGYRHVDLSRAGSVTYNVDQTMTQQGYVWDTQQVPACN